MKIVLSFLLLLISIKSSAQVWVNPNAVWTYDYSGVAEGGTFRWRYTHDSIIQGRTVQVLKGEKHQFVLDQFGQMHGYLQYFGNNYTSVSGDTVFYLINDQFYVLYHFGANIGDQWIIAENPNADFCNPISSVQVIDTGSVLINGQMKRTIKLETLTTGEFGIDGMAVEGIGLVSGSSNFGIFPGGRDCPGSGIINEWYMIDFRCFSDNVILSYNPSSVDCNYQTVSIDESDLEIFNISPNPSNGIVKIDNVTCITKIRLTDLSGKIVLVKDISPEQNSIDLNNLLDGTYFIEIGNKRAKISKMNI